MSFHFPFKLPPPFASPCNRFPKSELDVPESNGCLFVLDIEDTNLKKSPLAHP